MRFVPLLLLALGLLAGCSRSKVTLHPPPKLPNTMSPGDFITSPGKFHFEEKDSVHDIEITRTGPDISWSITRSQTLPHGGSSGGSGGGGLRVPEGSAWFVYLDEPGRYWISNGKDRLDYHLYEGSGSNGGPSIHDGKLLPNSPPVPKEVILRLPAELQKLFPPVEMPQKRPSI
jgi:hypothetical protein